MTMIQDAATWENETRTGIVSLYKTCSGLGITSSRTGAAGSGTHIEVALAGSDRHVRATVGRDRIEVRVPVSIPVA